MRVSIQNNLSPSLLSKRVPNRVPKRVAKRVPKRVSKRVCPSVLAPLIYIDLKVQPPLPKQDVTKTPKNHKTSQKDIIAAISKQPNGPSNILPLPWWLTNRPYKVPQRCRATLPEANLDNLFMPCQSSHADIYATPKYLYHADKIVLTNFRVPFHGHTYVLKSIKISLSKQI